MRTFIIGGLFLVVASAVAQEQPQPQEIALAVILEPEQNDVPALVLAALRNVERSLATKSANKRLRFTEHVVRKDDENEEAVAGMLCDLLATPTSLHAVLDLTYSGLTPSTLLTIRSARLPHFRLDITVRPPVAAATRWLLAREAHDAVIILADERQHTEALYELLRNSLLRTIAYAGLQAPTVQRMQRLRPVPAYTMVVAGAQAAADILDVAQRHALLERRADSWNVLVADDFDGEASAALRRQFPNISFLVPAAEMCCRMAGEWRASNEAEKKCACSGGASDALQMDAIILEEFVRVLAQNVAEAEQEAVRFTCGATTAADTADTDAENEDAIVADDEHASDEATTKIPSLQMIVLAEIRSNQQMGLLRIRDDGDADDEITYHVRYTAWSMTNTSTVPMVVAQVDASNVTAGLQKRGRVEGDAEAGADSEELIPIPIPRSRSFYRIGITEALPWTYALRDPHTHETILDPVTGQPHWVGYCIDMIERIAQMLDFDYELVPARRGTFGERLPDGTWDGLVGDLMTGDTDMAVGALKMTAEREEVIDFIPPYFEQTGILIAIRNPVRQTSLFKFMTVLRLEVWLSIVAALFATAIMIWLLDKYSPYSARNNAEAYPYPCRRFTLKESFWFALTSFTPQGGGEAPKSLSGRTMVSAYWLFVVLMLATFTANLAAFLTVERMQTPVQSLEQLARQSRINYTVVADSDTHQYFRNMKFAEDTLYRVWKEITLNSTHDQARYRVWEYPIREQYGQILMAIEAAQPVRTAEEGFWQVNVHENADYAFIHDSAEIRYEISRNCNLTEVGEVFAEQPYAIGIQQGSNLQDDLTRTVLRLQRERFFDDLTAKFWNHSAKGQCPDSDDSEGITLESLGGVFIATLFGLALSMVTLVGEVLYYRRRRARTGDAVVRMVEPAAADEAGLRSATASTKELIGDGDAGQPRVVTIGSEFVAAAERRRNLAYMSIFPRRALHAEDGDVMKVD